MDRFAANTEKNAARSHIANPRSDQEQWELDLERLNSGIAVPVRADEKSAGILLNGQRIDVLDKDNRLQDHPSKYLLHADIDAVTAESIELPPTDLLPLPHILPHTVACHAKVFQNTRTTPQDHWQDVRAINLEVWGDPKQLTPFDGPGNTVVIYPKNYPDDVQELIDLMGWGDVADQQVDLSIVDAVPRAQKALPRGCYPVEHTTLRQLLINNFDITSVPKRSFIEKISFHANDPRERERLVELTHWSNTQEFYDYTSRPRRTILELLRDFPSVKIPATHLPDYFPVIRGREFSIANGGASLHTDRTSPNGWVALEVEILVALVEYKTIIRKPRQGLCSRYLRYLQKGTRINVQLKYGNPPPYGDVNAAKPLIAIATGTGVAPIRALIHERMDYEVRGKVILFYGCRNRKKDFHYLDDWMKLHDRGLDILLNPVYSRDSPPEVNAQKPELNPQGEPAGLEAFQYDRGKNYVQHHIRKQAAKVCSLLNQGAFVCICGNSGRMPQSVRQALVDAAISGGFCKTAEEAQSRIQIWQETW